MIDLDTYHDLADEDQAQVDDVAEGIFDDDPTPDGYHWEFAAIGGTPYLVADDEEDTEF